ncbi:MAG: DMT family protein [Betaproteobacteria bacterium]|nr:DMT family protein [Betaproteobacteria bacterium]
MNPALTSTVMLAASSMVMTIARYAHLRFKHAPLWVAILGSWLIALVEHALQVPANRIGHSVMPAAQLRVIAEFFTLASFILFSVFYLREPMTLNYVISFAFILGAVYFAFWGPFR